MRGRLSSQTANELETFQALEEVTAELVPPALPRPPPGCWTMLDAFNLTIPEGKGESALFFVCLILAASFKSLSEALHDLCAQLHWSNVAKRPTEETHALWQGVFGVMFQIICAFHPARADADFPPRAASRFWHLLTGHQDAVQVGWGLSCHSGPLETRCVWSRLFNKSICSHFSTRGAS